MKRLKVVVLMLLAVAWMTTNGCVADNLTGLGAMNADLHVTVLWGDGDPVAYAVIATTKSGDRTRTDAYGHADLLTRSSDNSETVTVWVDDHPKSWTVGLQRGGTTATFRY